MRNAIVIIIATTNRYLAILFLMVNYCIVVKKKKIILEYLMNITNVLTCLGYQYLHTNNLSINIYIANINN